MTQLYRDSRQAERLSLCDSERGCIAARLAAIGVHYDHIALPRVRLDTQAGPDEVIGAYIEPLDRLLTRFSSVEMRVTQVSPQHPRLTSVDREMMVEHTHDVAEAQVLVDGGGTLFMHADDEVFALRCEAGDYVSLPAHLGHWFSLDREQGFRTIRLFEKNEAARLCWRGEDMRGRYALSCAVP